MPCFGGRRRWHLCEVLEELGPVLTTTGSLSGMFDRGQIGYPLKFRVGGRDEEIGKGTLLQTGQSSAQQLC